MACRILLFAFTCFLACGCNCNQAPVESEDCNAVITKDAMIAVANKVAAAEGPGRPGDRLLKEMDVYFDENNKRWKEVFTYLCKEDYDRDFVNTVRKSLKSRCYQAIRYTDKELSTAGQFWVFIDKKTGKVITYAGGI
jgi:hypothetical protein